MSQPRHLSKAPITEAVIDLRCQLESKFDLGKFAALEDAVGYGPPKEMRLFEFSVRHEPGTEPERHEVNHGLVGWRFTSSDGKQVVQFRRDGFTFSRLAPYTKWDEIFTEAERCYLLFSGAAQPEEVSRPAVRYINRMLFPEEEITDFSPFLTAPPAFPKSENVYLTGFFHQVQIQEADSCIAATVTQTVQPAGEEPGKVPVILDLDVYEPQSFPSAPAIILPRFAALREAKNRYFFASITEKAAQLFE